MNHRQSLRIRRAASKPYDQHRNLTAKGNATKTPPKRKPPKHFRSLPSRNLPQLLILLSSLRIVRKGRAPGEALARGDQAQLEGLGLWRRHDLWRILEVVAVLHLDVTKTLLGAPGLTTSNKKLLGAPGIATRSKKLLGWRPTRVGWKSRYRDL